jgi:hypothetical protein
MMTDGHFIEVEVEPAFACNRKCDFCARTALQKPDAFMDWKTMFLCAESIGMYRSIRVSIAGRGEPFLHEGLMDFVALVRSYAPDAFLVCITNGDYLNKAKAREFFQAGGNILGVDCYGAGLLERRYKQYHGDLPVLRGDLDGNPWKRRPSSYKAIVLMDDSASSADKTRPLLNRAGALPAAARAKYRLPEVTEPWQKKCVIPFRRPSIWWDGKMSICCHAYDESGNFSSIHEENLRQCVKNEKLIAARTALFHKRRDLLPPCSKCDFKGGYYQGLIQKMPAMTAAREAQIKKLWHG